MIFFFHCSQPKMCRELTVAIGTNYTFTSIWWTDTSCDLISLFFQLCTKFASYI